MLAVEFIKQRTKERRLRRVLTGLPIVPLRREQATHTNQKPNTNSKQMFKFPEQMYELRNGVESRQTTGHIKPQKTHRPPQKTKNTTTYLLGRAQSPLVVSTSGRKKLTFLFVKTFSDFFIVDSGYRYHC